MALATLSAANLFQVPCSATQADAYASFYTSKAELVDRILGGADLYAMALAIREDNEFASNISKLVAFVSYALAFPKLLALATFAIRCCA